MASTPFTARGAVDLGALAAARQNQQRADEALAHAPAGVVFDATADTFQADVVDRSMSVPVVVDLWAEWCEPCKQLSPILEKLAAEYAGAWVLAKVDVDAQPEIATAFQVQSIPSVVALVKGAPVPLFQGAYPEAQIRQVLDELLRVAAEEGLEAVPGVAAEADDATPADEEPVDPRFEAVFEAIEAGDWDTAAQIYKGMLASNPADADAAAGLAMVGLYRRTGDAEEPVAPSTDDEVLLAADFAALRVDWPTAFDLAIGVVRVTVGPEKEAARARVLDYFLMAGDDPSVPKARSSLASALY